MTRTSPAIAACAALCLMAGPWTSVPSLKAAETASATLSLAQKQTLAAQTKQGGAPQSPARSESEEALRVLNEVIKSQPSVDVTVQVALAHAFHKHGETSNWKKRARKRNWLPQLRIGGGARQWPVDHRTLVEEVDRFGVSSTEDLALSDQLKPMGYGYMSLTWDLDKLFFDPVEVDINAEKRHEAEERNSLIAQITKTYYKRLDNIVKLKLNASSMSVEKKINSILSIHEDTDLLNNLCGMPLFGKELVEPASPSPQSGGAHQPDQNGRQDRNTRAKSD